MAEREGSYRGVVYWGHSERSYRGVIYIVPRDESPQE